MPTILDIGCGYGGLIFELIKHFPDELILGMEIRDKVVNFVGEKVNSIRNNSGYKECMNAAAVRTNCMKTFHNYFDKDSLDKIFFCFADPHFKKANHRRRIINTALLTEYAYCLKPGGKIYTVTDVKDLHEWEVEKLSTHPMFERCDNDLDNLDICEKVMREETDEAKKFKRNGIEDHKQSTSIRHAVFRKRDMNDAKDAEACHESAMKFFAPCSKALNVFD